MSILLFIVILVALIIVHEFGHFLAAKRAGIRVDEFGIGFPPRLWGFKRGETLYSLNALPFGGFVKIFGEDKLDADASHQDFSRSLVGRSRGIQAWVLAAGILFNVFFAYALFSLGYLIGFPTPVDHQGLGEVRDAQVLVVNVGGGTPAERAGLSSGDAITALSQGEDTLTPQNADEARAFIAAHEDKIVVSYRRGGQTGEVAVLPQSGIVEGRKAIGVLLDDVGVLRLPPYLAPIEGARLTWRVTEATFLGLGAFFGGVLSGQADFSSIAGPVGIVAYVEDASQIGFISLLSLTALISINLAIINLIPFPALDGGRLFFLAIETIRRKPISVAVTRAANTVGFILLILLMVVVTYHDVLKLFNT